MTTYVDSNAGGANDGTSWTDAYTSLGSTTGVAAGELVLVEYRHSESQSSAYNWDWSNGTLGSPILIISADKDNSDVARTGASITCTDGSVRCTLVGNFVMQGVDLTYADELNVSPIAGEHSFFSEVNFSFNATTSEQSLLLNSPGSISIRGGSVTHNKSDSQIWVDLDCYLEFIGVDFSGFTATTLLFGNNGGGVNDNPVVLIQGCDISNVTTLVTGNGGNMICRVVQCKVNSSLVATASNIVDRTADIAIENCDDGTISVPPLFVWEHKSAGGKVNSSLAKYRSGGADDGYQANEHSWTLTGNSNTNRANRLKARPIVRQVGSGSAITITLYVAHNAVGGGTAGALTDAEFGMVIMGPDSAGSPTAQADYVDTIIGYQNSASDLTTDGTSTWNGTGVGTKQKVSYTYTPAVAGPLAVYPVLCINAAVQVDPYVEIT